MKTIPPVLALLLIVMSATPSWAAPQSPQTRDLSELSIEELADIVITTASKVSERASEAPATVVVVSAHDVRVRGYSTLGDLLKDLPGFETIEHYYSEQGTLVPVRGVVGNNKIVLLINGMRVNPPGGEDLMIRRDVSIRFADQIEVIYGPGSTLYGQDAISAIINIKTHSAEAGRSEVLGAYGSESAGEGFASFGGQFRKKQVSPISLTGFVAFQRSSLANFSQEFPVWWQKYSDFLTPIGRSAEPVRGDNDFNGLFRIHSKNASLQAWYRESSRSSSEGAGEGGASPVLWFVDEAHWRDRSLVAEGRYAFELTPRLTLHAIAGFNRFEIDPTSRYVFPNGAGNLFLQDFKYGRGMSESVEGTLDFKATSRTRISAGIVGSHYDIIPKVTVLGGADPDAEIVSQAGFLTIYTRAGDALSAMHINRAEQVRYRNLGMYAEGTHQLFSGLKAIAGVRMDRTSRFTEVPISPRVALVYSPAGSQVTLKYIFSKAFVAPAPYFGRNVFDNGVQISFPNPDLKPERAYSNEVNATWHSGHLMTSASVFVNRQSDLLITAQSEIPETIAVQQVFVNPDGTGSRLLRHSINLGSSKAVGLDLVSRINLDGVSFWGSYSFVDVAKTIGTREAGLDQTSRHNVRAGASWAPVRALTVTPSLVFRSTPENLTANYDIPGAALTRPYEINMNVSYMPIETLDAFVTVRNLSDNHYALRGISGPALQEPLSMMVGFRFRY
jgi:outer membrane receptor for ferrienterochelin and colicin